MSALQELILDLHISSKELQRLYRGRAKEVYAQSRDGRAIRFPANALRDHVTREGVHGTVKLSFDSEFRLKKLERLQ